MGDVYQHARLTIAASHAANSTQSCFFTRPPPLPTVELPHVTADGETNGSISAALLPIDFPAISPDEGALAYRAWATQEVAPLQAHGLLYGRLHCMVLQGRQSA